MKPEINGTAFGSITIRGRTYGHDVIIQLDGEVKKRKKKLSRAIFGTSHVVSLDEAEGVYEKGAERLIIGTGQYGVLRLSEEAADFFGKNGCLVDLQPTPQAIRVWNEAREKVVGLFHVTC
ncbi:MAG TPA: Mth938-like domain-containing protein [archaeon]|nr:Mth938-like domain-containing protein [archaeon]